MGDAKSQVVNWELVNPIPPGRTSEGDLAGGGIQIYADVGERRFLPHPGEGYGIGRRWVLEMTRRGVGDARRIRGYRPNEGCVHLLALSADLNIPGQDVVDRHGGARGKRGGNQQNERS